MTRKPKDTAGAQPELVDVLIKQPHTHRGIDIVPGTIIALRPPQAEALAKAGRAELVSHGLILPVSDGEGS